jgi:hypothetical protein
LERSGFHGYFLNGGMVFQAIFGIAMERFSHFRSTSYSADSSLTIQRNLNYDETVL